MLGGPQGRSGQVQKISPHTGIRSPDRPARSQSLYRLSYPAHTHNTYYYTYTYRTCCNVGVDKYVVTGWRLLHSRIRTNKIRWPEPQKGARYHAAVTDLQLWNDKDLNPNGFPGNRIKTHNPSINLLSNRGLSLFYIAYQIWLCRPCRAADVNPNKSCIGHSPSSGISRRLGDYMQQERFTSSSVMRYTRGVNSCKLDHLHTSNQFM
jgi:hypothetical protein